MDNRISNIKNVMLDLLENSINARHYDTIREISAAYRDICEAESFSNVVFLDENNNIKSIDNIIG